MGAPGDTAGCSTGASCSGSSCMHGCGAVYILRLNSGGEVIGEHKIYKGVGGSAAVNTDLDAWLGDGDLFGASLALLNTSGYDGSQRQLAVGAPRDDTDNHNAGAVYILTLNAAGVVTDAVKLDTSALRGGATTATQKLSVMDMFGFALAPIGDVNGDGNSDLAVGAPLDSDADNNGVVDGEDFGAVYILFLTGGATPSIGSFKKIASQAPRGLTRSLHIVLHLSVPSLRLSPHPSPHLSPRKAQGFSVALSVADRFGSSLALLPDMNSNGVGELAVGAPYADDGASGAGPPTHPPPLPPHPPHTPPRSPPVAAPPAHAPLRAQASCTSSSSTRTAR